MSDAPADLRPRVLQGHVLDRLRDLPDESVQCVVTSPPYWGLRRYGTPPQVWGGDPTHDHVWATTPPRRPRNADDAGGNINKGNRGASYDAQGGESCPCGSWRGELGAEPTPDLFVSHLADVFDEVLRVLRPDGTVWLNLGDSYVSNPTTAIGPNRWKGSTLTSTTNPSGAEQVMTKRFPGMNPKNLVGIPWRVAFELQRRGWYLRSDIIWAKRNPMPESVTDRPSRAHEYIFLLTKNVRYFYDQDAVREPLAESTLKEVREGYKGKATKLFEDEGVQDASAVKSRIIEGLRKKNEASGDRRKDGFNDRWSATPIPAGANLRSVWEISPQPFAEAHFATYPEELVERCIRLGTSAKGCCPECGAPWSRIHIGGNPSKWANEGPDLSGGAAITSNPQTSAGLHRNKDRGGVYPSKVPIGWFPTCSHGLDPSLPL